jgi:hypothetical protein
VAMPSALSVDTLTDALVLEATATKALVVYRDTNSVVIDPILAGQSVMEAAQDVTV